MRILLIAPDLKDDAIRAHQEQLTRDIGSSGLQATVMAGNVTRAEVVREMRAGRYDMLMAMTHGYAQGIQLAPGEWLEPGHLASLTRFGVGLVVLLACESITVAQVVMRAAGVDVIGCESELVSGDAAQFASLLVQGIADGLPVRDAYERALPGNDTNFFYLTPARPVQPPASGAKMTIDESAVAEHGRRLDEHGKRLDKHEDAIDKLKTRGTLTLDSATVYFVVILIIMLAISGFNLVAK